MKKLDILIDFDFSCVIPDYPDFIEIGAPKVLRRLVDEGHNLILFTCRSNKPYTLPDGRTDYDGLDKAVQWFKDNGIKLYSVQLNPKQLEFTTSPKCFGDLLIDDTALGAPTKIDLNLSPRKFIDWELAEQILENEGILPIYRVRTERNIKTR